VVVGSIILRFVGTLALVQKSAEITKFFLEPRPLQFAVGLAGGCELMGAAIDALSPSMSVGLMSQPTRRMLSIFSVAVRCGVLSSRTFRT